MNGLGIRSSAPPPPRPAPPASSPSVYVGQSRGKLSPAYEFYRWSAFVQLWHNWPDR